VTSDSRSGGARLDRRARDRPPYLGGASGSASRRGAAPRSRLSRNVRRGSRPPRLACSITCFILGGAVPRPVLESPRARPPHADPVRRSGSRKRHGRPAAAAWLWRSSRSGRPAPDPAPGLPSTQGSGPSAAPAIVEVERACLVWTASAGGEAAPPLRGPGAGPVWGARKEGRLHSAAIPFPRTSRSKRSPRSRSSYGVTPDPPEHGRAPSGQEPGARPVARAPAQFGLDPLTPTLPRRARRARRLPGEPTGSRDPKVPTHPGEFDREPLKWGRPPAGRDLPDLDLRHLPRGHDASRLARGRASRRTRRHGQPEANVIFEVEVVPNVVGASSRVAAR